MPPAEPLRLQAQAFIDALDAPETLQSDGRVDAEVVRVLAGINESIAKGGAPVAVGAAEDS